MFNISNNTDTIEFRFQRSTSPEAVEETLGRTPNEEEIAEAMEIPFSVDYMWCNKCENIFTGIENDFIKNILPRLRGRDFTGQPEVTFDENIIIRKFFLLQVYRTSIADPGYRISAGLQNELRELIFNTDADPARLLNIPLNITFQNTLGDESEYTTNTVGIASDRDNKIIIMNDFIIQVFENAGAVKFVDFMGFNDKATFDHYTNQNENNFVIKIINNDLRKKIWAPYHNEQAQQKKAAWSRMFASAYLKRNHQFPSAQLVESFLWEIIYSDSVNNESKYSKKRIDKLIAMFVWK